MKRTERKDITFVHTAAVRYGVLDRQYFCETKDSYEIWQGGERPHFIKRIYKKDVLYISAVVAIDKDGAK